MYKRSTPFALVLIICMFLVAIFPRPTNAQFIIASWDYPDEYGQGINVFDIFENSTGSWLIEVTGYGPSDNYAMEWELGVSIKLRCYTSFNYTLTGASDITDGQNYQRHNVTVTSLGSTVFSQENFTYYSSAPYADLYWYNYDVILNFVLVAGAIYTVTVTYEIFW